MGVEYLLPFSSAIFVYFTLCAVFGINKKKDKTKLRIEKLYSSDISESIHDNVLQEQQKKLLSKSTRRWGSISKEFSDYLSISGIKLNAREFLCAWAGLILIPASSLLIFGFNVISALGVSLVGLIIPLILLRREKNKRQQLFNKQLSEALVIMGNCIRSGYSFQQAIDSVASDMQPPISSEFSKTLRETRYGVKLEDALKHMVERVKDQDLDLLVCAIITSSQVGGNLSEILDTISSTIKDRIKIRGEVRVMTSSGRVSGIIIGLLPVIISIFLMMVNPDYIQSFFNTFIGKIMVVFAVILEITGFTIVNKIIDIKY